MTVSNVLKDKILLSRIKKSDRTAFINAYDLYIKQIYRFIYFKIGNREEAEDLSSAVFLKTWSYVQNNSITDYKTLKALFYKTARNIVIDHYRKMNRQDFVAIDNPQCNLELIDTSYDLVKNAEVTSDLIILDTKLPELKDEYREIIIMRFINELSIKEISEILDKSRGNVRIMIYRALSALKELMEEKE